MGKIQICDFTGGTYILRLLTQLEVIKTKRFIADNINKFCMPLQSSILHKTDSEQEITRLKIITIGNEKK